MTMRMQKIGAAAAVAAALVAFGAVHPASADQLPLPETATVQTLGPAVSLVVGGDCSTGYNVTLSVTPADEPVYIQLAEATGDLADPIGSSQTPITWLIGSSSDGVAEGNAPGGVIWTAAPLSIPAIFGVNVSYETQFSMGTNFPVEGEVEAPPCSTPTPTSTPTPAATPTPTPTATPILAPTSTASGGSSGGSSQQVTGTGGSASQAIHSTSRASASVTPVPSSGATLTPTAGPSPTAGPAIAPTSVHQGSPPSGSGIAWWVVTLLGVAVVVVVAGSATGAVLRRRHVTPTTQR